MHKLTNKEQYSLKITLIGNTDQEAFDSEYTSFKVGSEDIGYKLIELSGNSGTAGDILGLFSSTSLVHASFKTHETNRNLDFEDNRRSGWWYPEVQRRGEENSSSRQSGFLHFNQGNRQTNKNCYTHLNAYHPWFCDLEGKEQYVKSVRMYIKITHRETK